MDIVRAVDIKVNVNAYADDEKTWSLLSDLNGIVVFADIREHSENVAKYATMIYDNLPKKYHKYPRDFIYLSGYYHDIGKVMILRCFPDMLVKEQFDLFDKMTIKEHIHFGAILLYWFASRINLDYAITGDLFRCLLEATLYHHERQDGSGYLSLKEEHIPFIGQLIAVADSFSAGIESRVYSKPKEINSMLNELAKCPLNRHFVKALKKGINTDTPLQLSEYLKSFGTFPKE